MPTTIEAASGSISGQPVICARRRDGLRRRLRNRRRRLSVECAMGRRLRHPLRSRRLGRPRRSKMPCRRVTSCAFGGDDLGTLYVTSVRYGLSRGGACRTAAGRRALRHRAGVKGLPVGSLPDERRCRFNRPRTRAAEPLVRLRGVSKNYGTVAAVQPLDLDIARGDFVAILGPSGCGKTTLLRMIGGFVMPTTGTVEIGGRDVTRLGPEKRPTNMVFQGYGLFPHMNVRQNIAYGLKIAEAAARRRSTSAVGEMLTLVRLGELADRSIDGAVRRPAAARGARARADHAPAGAAARRAARGARPEAPAGDAGGAAPHPPARSAAPSSSSRTTRARRWRSPTASR